MRLFVTSAWDAMAHSRNFTDTSQTAEAGAWKLAPAVSNTKCFITSINNKKASLHVSTPARLARAPGKPAQAATARCPITSQREARPRATTAARDTLLAKVSTFGVMISKLNATKKNARLAKVFRGIFLKKKIRKIFSGRQPRRGLRVAEGSADRDLRTTIGPSQ
jgi:hypothetical protein